MLRTSTNWLALGRAQIRSRHSPSIPSRSLLGRGPSLQPTLSSAHAVHKTCPCCVSASPSRNFNTSHPHSFAATPPKDMPNPNKVTERLFQSPSKYIQGPSAIQNAGKYLSAFGKAPLLLSDELVYGLAGKDLTGALETSGFKVTRGIFGGEASREEVARVGALAKDNSVDFIVALGGGKTIDTAKAIADDLGLQIAVLPTTASTDAPCSALSVIYKPNGEFESYRFYSGNPHTVLVDTSVVVKAPARFLSAGIGDALATNLEAKAAKNSPNFGGGLPTEVATAIGAKCEEILFKYGRQAVQANKAKAVTPAFEAVVEANTLLSGLGFESGGLAAAHAIHNGLTAIDNHTLHTKMHGEKVAFGTICQLVLDGAPTSESDRYIALMVSVGLPVTLADLGIGAATDEELIRVARLACAPNETIWNMDRLITEEIVFAAIKGADAAGRDWKVRNGVKA
ncbi:glycerol dehydrogenase [Fomitopsis serialis]|uniref:glycerol dehydrogenase n=1 Tax=Fomitopsis serialis TaxID=139415 RepID=UPI002007B1E6|nr:glycerol dehydrogenase [Neoantrodia serialis]KAH9920437.1 glycerol dehydrogenase [Neoantrodia serialis]